MLLWGHVFGVLVGVVIKPLKRANQFVVLVGVAKSVE